MRNRSDARPITLTDMVEHRRGRAAPPHHRTFVVVGAVAVAALGGFPAPAVADDNWVQPGQVMTLIPSDDEVSTYYGMPMRPFGPVSTAPGEPVHLKQRDDCRDFFSVGTSDLVGSAYASYRSQAWDNTSQAARAIVTVVTFPSVTAAGEAFMNTYNQAAVNRCRNAKVVAPEFEPGATMDLVHIELNPGIVCSWLFTQRNYGANAGFTVAALIARGANFMVVVMSSQWGNAAVTMDRLSQHVLDRVH